MRAIAAELSVSVASVHGWTRDIRLTPEQQEAIRRQGRMQFRQAWSVLNRERRRSYQEEGRERARLGSDPLHMAGCMLYWAEGGKDRNSLCFANSDPHMTGYFCRFLRASLNVPVDRLTVRLNVYLGNDLSLERIEDFWLEALDLPRSCLRGHTLNNTPTSSSGRKRGRLPYGVCQLRVLQSTPVIQHIYGAIQEYCEFDEPRWLDGLHGREIDCRDSQNGGSGSVDEQLQQRLLGVQPVLRLVPDG